MGLIQGLLTSIKVAHQDCHKIMFDRAKSVLATMSKTGLTIETDQSEESLKEQKILLTETMATLLKPQKDEKLVKVYTECFLMLTKHHFENESLRPFVTSTYKELLKKFLNRCPSSAGLSSNHCSSVSWGKTKKRKVTALTMAAPVQITSVCRP